MTALFITGAGVSKDSGIPTFRGEDGVWTIGSRHYTPQEMATRAMYLQDPAQFLLWYFKRFAAYRDVAPNKVHFWLAQQCNSGAAQLITQNIDGLDGKAGNGDYISIHGRLDKMTRLHDQSRFDTRQIGAHENLPLIRAPWDAVMDAVMEPGMNGGVEPGMGSGVGTGVAPAMHDAAALDARLAALEALDSTRLIAALLDACMIPRNGLVAGQPVMEQSLKPYVLLFDEYYTDLYRMTEAEEWMTTASQMVFMGTSFSVNITMIALRTALQNRVPITIVDPEPVDIEAMFGIPEGMADITYCPMTAEAWVEAQ